MAASPSKSVASPGTPSKLVPVNVPPIPPFDPFGDPANIYLRWSRWIRAFELFADSTGCENKIQKRQLLLHCAGISTQDIFFTFDPLPADFDDAKAALEKHFKPTKNIPYNRHIFRQAKQTEGENILQFVTRLRQLAVDCDFGKNSDDFIRDQVIDKCISTQLRTKLLAQKSLTLNMCLEIAAAKEASERQATEMSNDEKVFAFRNKPDPRSEKGEKGDRFPQKPEVCGRCGQRGHGSRECKCSKNITCFKCQRQGHFANMCKSRPKENKETVRYYDVTATEKDSDNSEEYDLFTIGSSETLKIFIENLPVNVIVDSGASCNIIDSSIAEKLRSCGNEIHDCNKKIYPFHSPPIAIKQSVVAMIRTAEGKSTKSEFLIIPGSSPAIMSKSTAEALDILKIKINHIREDELLKQYPGLCRGIGKLKNVQVKLHVDPSVPPIARRHSRVPFHLRDKVAAELKRLEEEDVIEKVEGPTEWMSRIVAVPKPHNPGNIRICIDMREANKAIMRTRHVTPTIEDLISDLNGASIFSKIDLKAGYHQLELHSDSRNITTFSTHCGLFRYKRLSMGVNSAAETFQHTIQTLLADINGVKNVSDDIIIYGRNRTDHEAALEKTLRRLHESGLTVNKEKCRFRQQEIKFFGFVFSADGLKPDPEKVRALQESHPPKNASEVRSLLGMAQYSSRFIRKTSPPSLNRYDNSFVKKLRGIGERTKKLLSVP